MVPEGWIELSLGSTEVATDQIHWKSFEYHDTAMATIDSRHRIKDSKLRVIQLKNTCLTDGSVECGQMTEVHLRAKLLIAQLNLFVYFGKKKAEMFSPREIKFCPKKKEPSFTHEEKKNNSPLCSFFPS